MQGNLQQVPLPEVLQFISMGKSTGILQLRRGGLEISLSIHNGKIINSSALDRRRRLGDLLVYRGLLKRSELSRLLNLQKTVESDKRLGEILIEREIVDAETIRETLRLQLEEEIWYLFAWEDGEFRFETVSASQLGQPIVQIDIEPMILEGTRRNDEWVKIEQYIPHERIVLMTTLGDPDTFERDIELREHEWEVLSQINGRFTVQAVVNRSNMGRFEVYSILTQFIKTGLVVVRESDPLSLPEPGTTEVPAAAAGDREDGDARGGLLGVLGRKPKTKTESGSGFMSPVGALAAYSNALVQRATALKEYKAGPDDARIVTMFWTDLRQVFTRADLIRAHGNRVDARPIEVFFEQCGYEELIDECYEDALEGMTSLLRAVYGHFCRAAGEKPVARVARELLDEMSSRFSVKYRDPFPFAERIQNVLRIAA